MATTYSTPLYAQAQPAGTGHGFYQITQHIHATSSQPTGVVTRVRRIACTPWRKPVSKAACAKSCGVGGVTSGASGGLARACRAAHRGSERPVPGSLGLSAGAAAT